MAELNLDGISINDLSEEQLRALMSKAKRRITTLKNRRERLTMKSAEITALSAEIRAVAKKCKTDIATIMSLTCGRLGLSLGDSLTDASASSSKSAAPNKVEEVTAPVAAPSEKIVGKITLPKAEVKPPAVAKEAPAPQSVSQTKPKDVKKETKVVIKKSRRIMKRLPVKYIHPDNANLTWTGVGRKPKWVISCLESGISIDQLSV